MLWKTHIRIIREILNSIGFSPSSPEASRMRDGVITPDKWKDFPHHHGKGQAIAYYIQNARSCFLKNNLGDACYYLGIALHYVQDYYTSLSSRSRKHHQWEEQMDKTYISNNIESLIRRSFPEGDERRNTYLWYSNMLSRNVEGYNSTIRLAALEGPGYVTNRFRLWGNPFVDFNLALKASCLIARSVFSPNYSTKINENLFSLSEKYKLKMQETENSVSDSLERLSQKKSMLEKRDKKNNFIYKIRGFFNLLESKRVTFQLNRALKKYENKDHLKKILKEYKRKTEDITISDADWYIFKIPNLPLDCVEKKYLLKN